MKRFILSFLLTFPGLIFSSPSPYHFIQLGIVAPISTFGQGPLQHNSLVLHLGYLEMDKLSGISIGPITVLQERGAGWMLGLYQLSASSLWGVQMGIATVAEGLYGISLNLANINFGFNGAGVELGAFNFNGYKYRGLQLGALNIQPDFMGFHAGWLNQSDVSRGVELGILNLNGEFSGFQAGAINIMDRGQGVSIGIFNLINHDSIIPLGLVTIIKDRPVFVAIGVDSDNLIHLDLIHGALQVYNIYSVSKLLNHNFFTFAWGWGYQTTGKVVEWHIESKINGFIWDSQWKNDYSLELKTFVTLRAYEHFAVNVGISYHLLFRDPVNDAVLLYIPAASRVGQSLVYHWPGVFASWQF